MPHAKARTMRRPRLDEDVVPFTECRRTLSDCMERTARTHRPIVITHNGRAASVMIDVTDFEDTWNEIEMWRERAELAKAIAISRKQFENGEYLTEEASFDEIEKMLDEMESKGTAGESQMVQTCP